MLPDIYLSGRFTISAKLEKAWLKRSGCKHRCFSFAFVCPEKLPGLTYNKNVDAALKMCEDKKISIMMDSGAHSLHVISRSTSQRGTKAKKKQSLSVEEMQKHMFAKYAEFCHAHKEKWKFYVTLDFKREQPVIYKMQQRFHKVGLAPTPVFHGDSDVEYWLSKHLDMGHKFVCIGGKTLHSNLDYYFDRVFNFGAKHGMTFHGLAFTALDTIVRWPFATVDSSTWSKVASYGMLLMPDIVSCKLYNVHVSEKGSGNKNTMHNMTKLQKDTLAGILRDHGFDIKDMHKGPESGHFRHDWNGYVMSNLEKFDVSSKPHRGWDKLF